MNSVTNKTRLFEKPYSDKLRKNNLHWTRKSIKNRIKKL